MTEFYTIPEAVLVELLTQKPLNTTANILCPADPNNILAELLRKQGFNNIKSCNDPEDLVNPIWWSQQRSQNFDWVVAVTAGLKDIKNFVLDYGMQTAKKGLIILDRLSFLEPVESRRVFLTSYKLSNIVIFSPRPQFRALGGTKDSVTSAWYCFEHGWIDGPNLTYSVNWNRPKPLPALP